MTDYYRMIRSGFLEDTSLSLEAFRILAYLTAQAEGFTFDRDHLRRMLGIGRDKVEDARSELIAAGYLVPGKPRRVAGRFAQDGATVNWDRVCLPSSHRHPENQGTGDQGTGNQGDLTNNERTSRGTDGQEQSVRPSAGSRFASPPSVRPHSGTAENSSSAGPFGAPCGTCNSYHTGRRCPGPPLCYDCRQRHPKGKPCAA